MTTESVAGRINVEIPHVPQKNNRAMGNIKDGMIDFLAGSLGNVQYNRAFLYAVSCLHTYMSNHVLWGIRIKA